MKSLKTSWNKLAARYAAFSLRERRMVAAAAIIGPLLAGFTLLVEPQFLRAKGLRNAMEQQRMSLADLKSQAATLQVQVQADPDAAKRAELTALQQRVATADERLKKLQGTLVPSEEMNQFLERLLARHASLRLVSLKTLPPESILGPLAGTDGRPPAARQFDIYRHGVELRLEGGYLDLLAYLDQLEKADRKILWGTLQLSVVEYPKSQLTITLYTLGSDKAWLAI
jgi:MSHA biogenesis protein MshJ